MFKPACSFVSVVCLLALATPLGAQTTDVVGVRAQGMAGAFTAVADDATASWWNPAGMAGGGYFNALIETGRHDEPPSDRNSANARRDETRSIAVAFPALGLSYYHLRTSEIQPQTSTAASAGGRQEGGATDLRLRSAVLSQFGASVGQSIGSHLVIGSTVKLVTAGAVVQVRPAGTGSLDAAADVDPPTETHAGLDIGAMAALGRMRIGVMVRNVKEPEFGSGPAGFTLSRTARVGVAMSSGTRGVIGAATIAVDGDLLTTPTVLGDERRLAVGGELWTTARTIRLRGGVGRQAFGDRR